MNTTKEVKQKNTTPKNIFKTICLILLTIRPTMGAIIFDGTNSFSTYEGKAKPLKKLAPSADAGSPLILQQQYPGQIDYTITDTAKNRSNISDTRGMVIEAEGFYSLKGGYNGGQILANKNEGNYRVGGLPGAVLTYKITVKKPGIYTFSLDASLIKKVNRQPVNFIRLFAMDDEGTFNEAEGLWQTKYATDDWYIIAENYGGKSINDPFFLNIYLHEKHCNLILIFDSIIRTVQPDAIRVTNYRNEGHLIYQSKKYKENLSGKYIGSLRTIIEQSVDYPPKKLTNDSPQKKTTQLFLLLIAPIALTFISLAVRHQTTKSSHAHNPN